MEDFLVGGKREKLGIPEIDKRVKLQGMNMNNCPDWRQTGGILLKNLTFIGTDWKNLSGK